MRVRARGSWPAASTLLLGALAAASGDTRSGEAWQFHIINFNFETVQVTWNASEHVGTPLTFLYSFRDTGDHRNCSHYIRQQGHTVGCLLDAEGDKVLDFSIWNETHLLTSRKYWISDYLKPSTPKHLHFQWHQDAVTVTCPDLSSKGVLYQVQHKSVYDQEWQSTEKETCNITLEGLDTEKCYSFRARVVASEASYGFDTYPGDWSAVSHQQGGKPRESCQEKTFFPHFVLVCGLVAFLIIFLVLLSLWKLRRMKKLLVPTVPDPKFAFPGLFESHQGNFQEWIRDTQNVTHLSKLEEGETDYAPEETLVIQPTKPQVELPEPPDPVTTGTGDPSRLPCQRPQGEELVSLGGFTFVMGDNSYMML